MRIRLPFQTVEPYETKRKELKFDAEITQARTTAHVLIEINNEVRRVPITALFNYADVTSPTAGSNVVTLPVIGDYGVDYGPDYAH